MYTTTRRLPIIPIFALFAMVVALSACNYPGFSAPTPTTDPNLIYTQAAQTVAAQLTQSAAGGQATQPPPTATQPVVAVTATPLPPTATPLPTNTPVPTRPPIPCDRAGFVKDVTYPDGSELPPGTEYIKTWRLKNNGSCTWNSSYDLVFHGKNAMGGPAASQLTTGTVEPGETIDVSVKLVSPATPGAYEGDWKLRNGSDVVFGIGENAQSYFWVKITVVDVVSYDFLAKAKNADWYNATEALDFGDHNDDAPGVAAYGENVKLEDGKTYPKVLGTYPERITDGMIYGVFSTYKVKNGDHFMSSVGFKTNCTDGKVKFQLKYREGSTDTLLKEWSDSCNEELKSVELDLSSLKGKEVQFILVVLANGDFRNDKFVWIDPRISNVTD